MLRGESIMAGTGGRLDARGVADANAPQAEPDTDVDDAGKE
jgi:hypothetical protein